jgi:predicted nucleic acid-binding protein
MPEKWVANASPIISLAKLNQAYLLNELCEQLLIPAGVAREIKQGPDDDPAKLWLQKKGKKCVKDTGPINSVIASWDLGQGESDVISWAFTNSGWTAIIDDRAARNCAHSLNINHRGTIGILLLWPKNSSK